MRKKLFALAATAVTGAAFGQSSVTMYGVVDTAVLFGRGSVADKTQMSGGYLFGNRLGFRGAEDLGSGLSAKFQLEMGFSPDSGAGSRSNTNNQASGSGPAAAGGQGMTFNRNSWVGLSGSWGDLRFGRMYSPAYVNELAYETCGECGTSVPLHAAFGTWTFITGLRTSNQFNYRTPSKLGGFEGEVGYWLGENAHTGAATDSDGSGWGGRAAWTGGPFSAGVGYSRTKYAAGDYTHANLGASYDFKMAKLWAQWVRNTQVVKSAGWMLGVTVPISAGELHASYSTYKSETGANPRSGQIGIGYWYNLSKRTALYASWAHLKNKNGAALAYHGAVTSPNASSSGVDIGIKHAF